MVLLRYEMKAQLSFENRVKRSIFNFLINHLLSLEISTFQPNNSATQSQAKMAVRERWPWVLSSISNRFSVRTCKLYHLLCSVLTFVVHDLQHMSKVSM